jgi:hypothetical protein
MTGAKGLGYITRLASKASPAGGPAEYDRTIHGMEDSE